MVTPGGALREFADDWTPIFADLGRRYDYVTSIARHRRVEGGVRLEARMQGGEAVRAEPAFVAPEVHAEGDASGLAVRQEDRVTVVEVRGGEFKIRARVS